MITRIHDKRFKNVWQPNDYSLAVYWQPQQQQQPHRQSSILQCFVFSVCLYLFIIHFTLQTLIVVIIILKDFDEVERLERRHFEAFWSIFPWKFMFNLNDGIAIKSHTDKAERDRAFYMVWNKARKIIK